VDAIDPNALPQETDVLQRIVRELCEKLKYETAEKDKYRSLLRELLDAQRNRKSEQLSKDQLALFGTLWKASHPEEEPEEEPAPDEQETKPEEPQTKKSSGRQPLAQHLVRERIIHDLAESVLMAAGEGSILAGPVVTVALMFNGGEGSSQS
jgi:hypothetical protein